MFLYNRTLEEDTVGKVMNTINLWLAMLAALAVLHSGAAIAQAKPDDILNYQGPDREKRLIEQARREGTLTLYT